MILYFIAGFIAGVIGTLMLGKHFADKAMKGNGNDGIHRQE